MRKKQSAIGWMNKEDWESFSQMFEKDGVTHIDIFKDYPNTKDEISEDLLDWVKVKVNITPGGT